MAALESGTPYGPGLDGFGLAPERLVTVAVAQRRDLMWAMEEALRCRAVGAVIGELRHGALDTVAVRRLSLAAADSGALALLLRAAPEDDASTAATRWVVGAAPLLSGARAELATAKSNRFRACIWLRALALAGPGMTRREWPLSRCSSCATGVDRAATGFSNGATAMAISHSQRMLSLWLRRLPTDRIERSREASQAPSRRLRQARQCRRAGRGQRRGGQRGLNARPGADAGARHASLTRRRAGGRRGRRAAARAGRRLVPALHPAHRLRRAGRPQARHRRLRASLRRRGGADRRSLRAARTRRLCLLHRRRRLDRRGLCRRALRRAGQPRQWRRAQTTDAAAARRAQARAGHGRVAGARRLETHRRHHRPAAQLR